MTNQDVTGENPTGKKPRIRPSQRKTERELMHVYRDKAIPTQLYFIETVCAERHVKIGVASNVRARMRKMQMDCPYTLRLIKRVADSAALEREIHNRFEHLRLGGEWFVRSEQMEAFIAGLDGSQFLETHTDTKGSGWYGVKAFPADEDTVRTTVVRPGVRNQPFTLPAPLREIEA